ncbi:MAG TPA: DUF6428 family protein [Oligoflexia bacterium]|nr:DUF6428 family protein [Oligoflexia bacterium]HMP49737.1 DUF6428 family protein [Oligoflexia bacterium]
MKLNDVKSVISSLDKIIFSLPDGSLVPSHFHVTEVGKVSKHFIDCGGTVRNEEVVNFQLWNADDYDHRLHPDKLLKIIQLSEKTLGLGNHEIEVEYQGSTIQKFGLEFNGETFLLVSKNTDCLAKDKCGVSDDKQKTSLKINNACEPGTSCC